MSINIILETSYAIRDDTTAPVEGDQASIEPSGCYRREQRAPEARGNM